MKKTYKVPLFIIGGVLVFLLCSFAFFFDKNEQNLKVSSDLSFQKYTVIIDAGHGGRDSGAVVGDVFEKDLNLQISEKIAKVLSFYEVDVVQTRTSDTLLADENSKNKKRDDLKNRVDYAKNFQLPIFVSVHMNKFPEEKYKGLQVFYSKNNPDSNVLANLIQENNKFYITPENTRQTKKATSSIYIMDRLNCPAVLIECGFISNKSELEKLKDDEYQNQLAVVISNSIIEFINNLGC